IGAMTLPPDSSLLEINDSAVKQCACSLQEVTCIALCLETNDVISCESAINSLSYVTRQKLPASNIMQHDNRCCILMLDFNIYSFCNCAVGNVIAIFPGILKLTC